MTTGRRPRASAARVVLLTAVALALPLSGCGTDGASPAAGSPGGDPGRQTLTVLAAASLTDVLGLVAADFEADHAGVTVEQSFAASSTIVQQVNEGAPADVVALAGEGPLARLEDGRRTTEPVVFTTNTLQLAVPPDDPAGIDGVEDLARDGIRLVVCRPEAPCGAATQTLLEQTGIDPVVSSYEPDVRAVLSKVALGEADVGVVYRTDVAAAGDAVVGVDIPPADTVVSSYPALAVSDAPLARAFVDELLSDRAQQHLADAGFVAP